MGSLLLNSGSHCTCLGSCNFPVIRGLGKLLRLLLTLLGNDSMSVFCKQREKDVSFALRKSENQAPFCCHCCSYSGLQLASVTQGSSSPPAASPGLLGTPQDQQFCAVLPLFVFQALLLETRTARVTLNLVVRGL